MIYSGNSFYERAEIKDMMAYFKLCVNPYDDESFKRTVNKPARGIGATTMQCLELMAREMQLPLFRAGFEIPKVKPFCEMIEKLALLVKTTDAYELAKKIADDSGLYAFFKSDNSVEGQSRTSNIEELVDSVAVFVEERRAEAESSGEADTESILFTLDDYLENVALLSNADTRDDEENASNKVSLMTVHSAKGLEYPYVLITGLEENLFPSLSMLSSRQDGEEERRLFYVAVTRAQKAVTLSYSSSRMRNGKHESNSPSRFIKEIDSRYILNPLSEEDFAAAESGWGGFGGFGGFSERSYGSSSSPRSYGSSSRPRSEARSFGSRLSPGPENSSRVVRKANTAALPVDPDFKAGPMNELYEGERVVHNRFGAGLIKSISGGYPDLKAVIDFDEHGEKLLLLRYANLRPEQ